MPESSSALRKARRYKDILGEIVGDLGGNDRLSEAQRQMCRRATTIGLQLEHMDADAAEVRPVDWDLYGRLAGHQRRLFEVLGIERRARDVGPTIDSVVTAIRRKKPVAVDVE